MHSAELTAVISGDTPPMAARPDGPAAEASNAHTIDILILKI